MRLSAMSKSTPARTHIPAVTLNTVENKVEIGGVSAFTQIFYGRCYGVVHFHTKTISGLQNETALS